MLKRDKFPMNDWTIQLFKDFAKIFTYFILLKIFLSVRTFQNVCRWRQCGLLRWSRTCVFKKRLLVTFKVEQIVTVRRKTTCVRCVLNVKISFLSWKTDYTFMERKVSALKVYFWPAGTFKTASSGNVVICEKSFFWNKRLFFQGVKCDIFF